MRRLLPDLVDPDDRGVRNGLDVGLDDQGDLEDGLAVRLVEAGEGPPGVDGLELGRGHGLGLAVEARCRWSGRSRGACR